MITLFPPKLPGETRTYRHSFAAFLGEDTIASLTVESDDVTISGEEIEDGEQSVVFKASAGTLGEPAYITVSIVSVGGMEEEETLLLPIDADEPVSLTDAKAQCRMVEDDSEDAFIASLIAPARAYVERVSKYSFVARERAYTFSAWGEYLEIFLRPIVSVDAITYGPAGDETEYENAIAPVSRYPLRIYPSRGLGFPDLNDGEAIRVTLTTGAVSPTSEEYLLGKRAMLLLIGHWFENRETAVIGQASAEVDFAVRSLLDELRPVSVY